MCKRAQTRVGSGEPLARAQSSPSTCVLVHGSAVCGLRFRRQACGLRLAGFECTGVVGPVCGMFGASTALSTSNPPPSLPPSIHPSIHPSLAGSSASGQWTPRTQSYLSCRASCSGQRKRTEAKEILHRMTERKGVVQQRRRRGAMSGGCRSR